MDELTENMLDTEYGTAYEFLDKSLEDVILDKDERNKIIDYYLSWVAGWDKNKASYMKPSKLIERDPNIVSILKQLGDMEIKEMCDDEWRYGKFGETVCSEIEREFKDRYANYIEDQIGKEFYQWVSDSLTPKLEVTEKDMKTGEVLNKEEVDCGFEREGEYVIVVCNNTIENELSPYESYTKWRLGNDIEKYFTINSNLPVSEFFREGENNPEIEEVINKFVKELRKKHYWIPKHYATIYTDKKVVLVDDKEYGDYLKFEEGED